MKASNIFYETAKLNFFRHQSNPFTNITLTSTFWSSVNGFPPGKRPRIFFLARSSWVKPWALFWLGSRVLKYPLVPKEDMIKQKNKVSDKLRFIALNKSISENSPRQMHKKQMPQNLMNLKTSNPTPNTEMIARKKIPPNIDSSQNGTYGRTKALST